MYQVDAPDLGALSRRLRKAGRSDLNRHMRARMREAVRPIILEQKANLAGIPSKSGRGMRARIAAALKLQMRAKGVRIKVDTRQLPGDMTKLPQLLDKGRWRHMVFGDPDNWVAQTVPAHWFRQPHETRGPTTRAKVMQAMNDTAREIG